MWPRAALLVLVVLGPGLPDPANGDSLPDGFTPSPPLALDAASLPRLAGTSAVASRINEELDRLDAAAAELLDCRSGTNGYFTRETWVEFPGPEFVTFGTFTGFYCDGAAHPWSGTTWRTFDLVTGGKTDLLDVVPATMRGEHGGGRELWDLYIRHLSASDRAACLPTLGAREGGLELWLSADGPALGMIPALAYVERPCENPVMVPLPELEQLGFGPRVVRALRRVRG